MSVWGRIMPPDHHQTRSFDVSAHFPRWTTSLLTGHTLPHWDPSARFARSLPMVWSRRTKWSPRWALSWPLRWQ